MSAGAVRSDEFTTALDWESSSEEGTYPHERVRWNREDFAREQIRGLVRQVFFTSPDRPVRQVVFSPVDPEKEVLGICRQVAETLSSETQETVAVVGGFPQILNERQPGDATKRDFRDGDQRLRQTGTKVRGNLWWIPTQMGDSDLSSASALHAHLSIVRREFEYSIIEARSAAESHAALAMSQFADGIILVLSARYTRRAVARQIKASLEGTKARILGTVLSDRGFPVPESIYRRL